MSNFDFKYNFTHYYDFTTIFSASMLLFFYHLTIATCLILALQLMLKREKHGYANIAMSIAMLYLAVISTRYTLIYTGSYAAFLRFKLIIVFCMMFFVPTATAYFILLTKKKLSLADWVGLFGPTLIMYAIVLIFYFADSADYASFFKMVDGNFHGSDYLSAVPMTILLYNAFLFIEFVASAVYIYIIMRSYNRKLSNYYSYLATGGIKRDKIYYTSVFVLYVLALFYSVKPLLCIVFPDSVNILISAIYTILIFLIGFHALTVQPSAADKEARAGIQSLSSENKISSDESTWILEQRLNAAMDNEIWKHQSLTLDELSKNIGTNRTYLSRFINQKYGQSFSEYVNSIRIVAAKALLVADESMSVDDVASESGFAKYNTFYYVFKQTEGCSPSEWRKKMKGWYAPPKKP